MNNDLVKIKDTTFVREMKSKAILETDRKRAQEYLARKKTLGNQKEQKNEIEELKIKVSSIETGLDEIKELLKGLINNGSV